MATSATGPYPAIVLRPMPAPRVPGKEARVVKADTPASYPCRRCLRDAEVGETMRLESYDPFLGESPYSGPGPIYLHADGCERFHGDGVPDQLRRRLLSFRAYATDHMMIDCDIAAGVGFEEAVGRMFANRDVAYVHVHNARPGCFAVRVDRAVTGSRRVVS